MCRKRLLAILICLGLVAAYPSAPGTCNMNKMATIGHGPSKSTCKDCYGVKISTDTPSLVNIHLTGRFAYQGIVLLVKDRHTNKTLGEFQDFDTNLFTSVACDDDEDEQDQIEPDSMAVLGHIDPKLKEWPVNVGWNMIATKPVTELKLQGMIVIDYDNFHLLPETEFTLKRKVLPATITTATTTTTAAIDPLPTHIVQVEHEPGTIIQQESNTLFIWVLSLVIFLYISMSICYRQLKRKKQIVKSTLLQQQPQDIALVIKSS
ncbi:putative endonuclease lcl3 [Mucor velutinosus]|uniref:Endonuclease lcl3 n=1 Tax=Mucor velutinosus TaxID=708070 RepID=A0AAN7HZV3_9FUNG|nr:putative endonuclease lcl3 [Mucor velutinosus]